MRFLNFALVLTFMSSSLAIAGVKSGDKVSVIYTLKTQEPDADADVTFRDIPFTFRVGSGGVLSVWNEGLIGMEIGEKRKLAVPAKIINGSEKLGAVTENAKIIYEVDLINIDGGNLAVSKIPTTRN